MITATVMPKIKTTSSSASQHDQRSRWVMLGTIMLIRLLTGHPATSVKVGCLFCSKFVDVHMRSASFSAALAT